MYVPNKERTFDFERTNERVKNTIEKYLFYNCIVVHVYNQKNKTRTFQFKKT